MFSSKFSLPRVRDENMRSIYESLDFGENEMALAEVSDLLERTPNNVLAVAVKALILVRLEEKDEARYVLNKLTRRNMLLNAEEEDESYVDDGNSATMIYLRCYLELKEPERVCSFLGNLCRIKTNSEELHVHHFMSLVRVQDFKRMHQIALDMYKKFSNPKYFMWAIATLVLPHDHFHGPFDFAISLSYKLAGRMAEKFLSESNAITIEDKQLFLDLYIKFMVRHSTEWNKTLELFQLKGYPSEDICNCEYGKYHENYCLVLERCGLKSELLAYLKDIFIKGYPVQNQIVDLFGKDETRKEVLEFINNLRENQGGYEVALGSLYFTAQNEDLFSEATRNTRNEEDILMAIQFGMETPTFYQDVVVKYLRVMEPHTKLKLLHIMTPSPSVKQISPSVGLPHEDIMMDLNFEMTSYEFNSQRYNRNQHVTQANQCFGDYLVWQNARMIVQNQLASSEGQNGEGQCDYSYLNQYAILSASILLSEHFKSLKKSTTVDLSELLGGMQVGEETGKKNCPDVLLLSAIFMMERCLSQDPTNGTLRFMLMNTYARMGAAFHVFKTLGRSGVNHYDLNLLGYLIFPSVITCGFYQNVISTLRKSELAYTNNYFLLTNDIIDAYQECDFQRVATISLYREGLMHSKQFGFILVEKCLLEFMMETETLAMLKNLALVVSDQLTNMWQMSVFDKRDLTIVLNSLAAAGVNENNFQEHTASMENFWVKMRLCLLTIVTHLVSISIGQQPKLKVEAMVSNICLAATGVLEHWKSLCDKWRLLEASLPWKEIPFFGAFPPLYTRWLQLLIPEYLMEEAECVVKLVQEKTEEGAMSQLKKFHIAIMRHAPLLLKVVEENLSAFQKDPSFHENETYIPDLHFVLEYFSFSKIILAAAVMSSKTRVFEKRKGAAVGKKGLPGKASSITISFHDNVKQLEGILDKMVGLYKEQADLSLYAAHNCKDNCFEITSEDSAEVEFLKRAFPSNEEDSQIIPKFREGQWAALSQMRTLCEGIMQFVKSS